MELDLKPLSEMPQMELIEKLPQMSDGQLANLLANARRLGASGGPRQQADAAALLPALEAAVADRKAAKLKTAASKRATSKKPAP